MKKILIILTTALVAFSCQDFNEDHFDWYEDAQKIPNVEAYEYTITDGDIATIVSLLRANRTHEDSVLATGLNSARRFSETLDAAYILPFFVENKYFTADVKSSVKVTYPYDSGRDAVLSGLSGDGYELTDADYEIIWGSEPPVSSLTPAKPAAGNIPAILAQRFPDAKEGDYKTVEYYYSEEEPVTTLVEGDTFLEETFEGYQYGTGVPVDIPGWINKDTKASLIWQSRYYNNDSNTYAQVSSYQTGVENDAWLITEAIDLTQVATTPKFSFDIVTGNYNATCLKIFISKDFDGTEANILSATWDDVTSNFTLPTPSSGYSTWATAGTLDISAYKGETIYIGFLYEGNDLTAPKATTTYQVDNVKVWEEVIGVDVEEKSTQYATYTYTDGAWKAVGSDIITLQPSDYAEIGMSYGTLSTTLAAQYLPQYLIRKLYAAEDTEKIVVYRTSAGIYYADRFTYTGGSWVQDTTLSEETSQFVRVQQDKGKAWIFDPMIINTMTRDDYHLLYEYVKDNYSAGNPNIIHATRTSEFYYGFSSQYSNVSYREIDRAKDLTYPADGTNAEKVEFMNERTVEGLKILLAKKYPNAEPTVSGVTQYARVDNLKIYSEPNAAENVIWTYYFECVGDKEWEFVGRQAADGRVEGEILD